MTRPPRAQIPHRAHHVAMGKDAALRRGRIAAEDDEQVGMVEVWNGNFPFIAEHQHGRQILGVLIDRTRRIDLLDARRRQHQSRIARQRGILPSHIAAIGRERMGPMALAHPFDQRLQAIERCIPRGAFPFFPVADHRRAKPVGIMMERAQRRAFGADMAQAPTILLVGADGRRPSALHVHGNPAHPLTQGAGAMLCAIVRHHYLLLAANRPLSPVAKALSLNPSRSIIADQRKRFHMDDVAEIEGHFEPRLHGKFDSVASISCIAICSSRRARCAPGQRSGP